MNVTFMIGNGFDLNCGIKTSFRDVFMEYCKTESYSLVIANFKKEIDSNIETWADFEMSMNNYLPNFKTESDFLDCLWDFQNFMTSYLRKEETNIDFNSLSKQSIEAITREFARSVEHFYEGVNNNITRRYRAFINAKTYFTIISFNYTSIMDELARRLLINNIIHVHGTLSDAPVLGIDNESQLSKNTNFPISKSIKRAFIKPVFNKEYDEQRTNLARSAIHDSSVICVFGLSLGDSDQSWKNILADWLVDSSSNHLFYYDYKYSRVKSRIASEQLDIEDKAKEELLEKLSISEKDRNIIATQIHIPCGKNIFNIHAVLLDSLKNELNEMTDSSQIAG